MNINSTMNENQLPKDEIYLPATDNSIDVRNSQFDNNYSHPYSTSQSFFHDPSANGTTQSYSTHATNMVHHMVYQLHLYVKDNQDLKQSIKLNNAELEKRFNELEAWKNSQKNEKLLLKRQFDKAYKSTTNLKNENAILKSENIKLELRVEELISKTNLNHNENQDDETVENHSDHGLPSSIYSKYLATVQNLESRLKEAIASCKKAQLSKEQIESVHARNAQINQSLQQKLHEQQQQLRDYEIFKKNSRAIEISYQNLTKELRISKERCQNAEKSNKEVKAQLLQVLSDVSAYQSETETLKAENQSSKTELKEQRNRSEQTQEQYLKVTQEFQNLKIEKKQETMNLEKKIAEKNQTLDELYHEYEKFRQENERLRDESDNMYARIICADESLNKKDRELKEQKEMSTRNEGRLREDLRKLQEDVTFFKAQADVYKQDFLQEREDRAKTHEMNEQLRARVEQLQNPGARFDQMRR